jgi:hypothetical protein
MATTTLCVALWPTSIHSIADECAATMCRESSAIEISVPCADACARSPLRGWSALGASADLADTVGRQAFAKLLSEIAVGKVDPAHAARE